MAKKLTINVIQPGTLATLVGEKAKYTTKQLTLSGFINGDDLRFLREMTGSDANMEAVPGRLRKLNLSGVHFVPGKSVYAIKETPQTITETDALPKFAFRKCPIESIVLPKSINKIDIGAFEYTAIKRITLPENIKIGPYAFNRCKELEEVIFPQFTYSINAWAFSECPKLKHINLYNVGCIMGWCFSEMPTIESICVRGRLLHIDGWNTFYQCPKLQKIVFCGMVISTGGPNMFVECPSLKSVVFENDVLCTAIGQPTDCPQFKGFITKRRVLNSMTKDGLQATETFSDEDSLQKAICKVLVDNPSFLDKCPDFMPQYLYSYQETLYNEGCYQALAGNTDAAFKALELAVFAGFRNYSNLKKNNYLTSLRNMPRFDSIYTKCRMQGDFLAMLKHSKPYNHNTNTSSRPAFTYQSPSDSALQHIRNYFNLDSIAGKGDDISRIKRMMYWLHDAIPHDGASPWPQCSMNAIDLYETAKRDRRGLNCRQLSIILNELYLAEGFKSRYLTCLPCRTDIDNDCHVINVVWSTSLNKWVWMDASFAAFVCDENGNYLHPGEVRERLINDRPLVLNSDANWNHKSMQTKENYLYNYMAKNLYVLICPLKSLYDNETNSNFKSPFISLTTPDHRREDATTSNDDSYFWQAPQ